MIWRNTKDTLPEKGQEVIIRYKGECNLAIFNAAETAFIINVGPDIKVLKKDIFWMESKLPVKKIKKNQVLSRPMHF